MKKRTTRLEGIYNKVKRKITEKTIYDLVISEEGRNINYKNSYQRKYIWNITKAVNFIETILINGEVPPITVTKSDEGIRIVDRKAKIRNIIKIL